MDLDFINAAQDAIIDKAQDMIHRDDCIRGLIRLAVEYVKDSVIDGAGSETCRAAGLFLSKTDDFAVLAFRTTDSVDAEFVMVVLDVIKGDSYTLSDLAELDVCDNFLTIDEEFLQVNELTLKDYIECLIGTPTLEFKCVPRR